MSASPPTVIPGLGLVKPVPSSEYSSNIIVKNFPLLGRLHFVKDKNGIMSLAFTFLYWVYGTWCGLWVVLLPHLRDKQTSEPFVGCKQCFSTHWVHVKRTQYLYKYILICIKTMLLYMYYYHDFFFFKLWKFCPSHSWYQNIFSFESFITE